MYDLIVIGGGASGMMAAGRAAELGKKVLLLEKNRTMAEKLKISGGGRCNITNAELDERKLLPAYGKSEQFLYSTFAQFGVKDTFSFFESRGLPLVVQARKRAFPNTEKAADVFRVLEAYMKKGGVEVRTATPVTRVEKAKDGSIAAVYSRNEAFTAKKYIFASGGVSHPETGSTGDGLAWLKALGHTVQTYANHCATRCSR
jgi:predicted Rossmann fold flavoprotein